MFFQCLRPHSKNAHNSITGCPGQAEAVGDAERVTEEAGGAVQGQLHGTAGQAAGDDCQCQAGRGGFSSSFFTAIFFHCVSGFGLT